jgi:hypothetical protein
MKSPPSGHAKVENPPESARDKKLPRVRGIGNVKSHSQDADRHRKVDHLKSDK